MSSYSFMSEEKKHIALKNTEMHCIRGGKFGEVHIYADKTLRYRSFSKKLLKSLPAGVVLMSNTSSAPGRPDFLKQLESDSDLNEVWKEVLAARVNHRTVWVFSNASTAKDWIKRLLGKQN
jgi:hypothetical protein